MRRWEKIIYRVCIIIYQLQYFSQREKEREIKKRLKKNKGNFCRFFYRGEMEERYPHVKYSLRVFIRNPDEIPAQRIIDAIFLRRAVFRGWSVNFALRDSSGVWNSRRTYL